MSRLFVLNKDQEEPSPRFRLRFDVISITILFLRHDRAYGHAVVAVFGVHLGTRREEVEVAADIRIARAKCRRPVVACSPSEARRTKSDASGGQENGLVGIAFLF